MISNALDQLTPTLRDVAREADVGYGTMRAYRLGTRTAPAPVIRRLARAMRDRAARLVQLAERLEREADRDT